MLERIFVDNFRCFVNFEWKPGKLALLLGENGSGKTSIVDVLWAVRGLVIDEEEVRQRFPNSSRTQWDLRREQRVELSVRLGQDIYAYELIIAHDSDDEDMPRVKKEVLRVGDLLLMDSDNGLLRLQTEAGGHGTAVFGNPRRSGLGFIAEHPSNKKLTAFKHWLGENVWCFKPDPRAMVSRTDVSVEKLNRNLDNFAAWYRSFVLQDLEAAFSAKKALEEVIPGFETLSVEKTRHYLQARLTVGSGSSYSIDFSDLSDGQRMLITLYVLRHAVVKPGRLIVFDEATNYVALSEIQPWLMEIVDAALASDGPQVWFVSHHPELLNQLAPAHGARFFRQDGGPARVAPFKESPGLTPSEAVARGWESE
jgi:ABC-type molybdenum transport system ATPase subunit/photorepair protein PhrA